MQRAHAAAILAGIASIAAVSCGGGDDERRPSPTTPSAYRATHPCKLFTRSMAQELLSVGKLRRIGAQTLGAGVEQCLYARGRYKGLPQVGLVVHPDDRAGAEDGFAQMQRRISKIRPPGRYRALSGLGDRALLVSNGVNDGVVLVVQGGRSFGLRMLLAPRRKPLPPLAALERTARRISVRFDP